MTKTERRILSFVVSIVLALNLSAPLIYAMEFSGDSKEVLPYCDLFCNLTPSEAKNTMDIPCPHHAKEAKMKRLNELYQCKISQAPCHSTPSEQQTASQADPYLLSDYAFDGSLNIIHFYSARLNIPFQIYDFSLEKPPTILS